MEFYVSSTRVCADGTTRNSGETFSCERDASTAPQGAHELTARASDAAGNTTTSEPLAITIPPPNRAPTLGQVTATPISLDEGASTLLSVSASDPDGHPLTAVTRSVQVQVRVPSYARDIQPLWSPTCTTCHSDSGTPGALNLESGSSYASLVNRNGTGACSSLKRVQPGQPDDSLLVLKISGTGCGGRMPQLDSDYFDRNPGELIRIRSWILAGAPND
jgi:hypothetical protein